MSFQIIHRKLIVIIQKKVLKDYLTLFFFSYIRKSKNLSAKYYQKKKAFKIAHQKYQNLFQEEKNKKQQYGRERYKTLPEDEKTEAS